MTQNAPLNFLPKGKTYIFHMSGGQSIHVPHVEKLTMKSNTDGRFSAYEIKWVDGHRPDFFSLSIPEIIAVTTKV